ncbi:MAG: multiubiquitin domain-containing protein [Geothrix sp.]|nr:multiubiquitin domain-containing protein [Geothrix sp.]
MGEHQKEFHFFVDGKKYSSPTESVTGATIKSIAGVPPAYQLFLETHGGGADQAISDGEGIVLSGGEKHFYAVPPATFGTQQC